MMRRHRCHLIALMLLLAALAAISVVEWAWAQEESGEGGGEPTPTETTAGAEGGSSEEGGAGGEQPEEGGPGEGDSEEGAPGEIDIETTGTGTIVSSGTDTLAVDPDAPPVPPDGQEPTPEGAPDASTIGRGFHPTYTSKYDVNRNTQAWTQTLQFSTGVGDLTIANTTSVRLGEDTTLRRDSQDNDTQTTLAYDISKELKLSGTLGFRRSSTIDGGQTESRNNSDNLTASLEYTPTLARNITGRIVGNGGTRRTSIFNRLTSDRESDGPFVRMTADFDQKGQGWDWGVKTLLGRSQLSSREATTGTTTDDSNLDGNLQLSASWRMPGLDNFAVTLNRDFTRTQEPFTGGETVVQETSTRVNRGFIFDASSSPLRNLGLSTSYTFRNNDVNRVVDLNRAQETIDRLFASQLDYLFPDSTKVNAKLDLATQRTLYDADTRSFLNGDIDTRTLGGRIDRPFSRKASIQASGQYELRSYLFDDTVDNQDDRDVVRADFGARLNYDPARKINTVLGFTFKHDQTIFVDASKSSANQTQQTYTINPRFTYHINPRLTFNEDAQVVAIARVFDFDEDQNRLSRTTEFRSSIDAKLHRTLDGQLRHVYRILQDGSYRRAAPGEPRKFGKSSETLTRDLTLRFDYKPFQGGSIYFRTNKRLGDTTTRQVIGGEFVDVKSSNEYTELEVGGQLNYTLRYGTKLGLNARRVQNWTDRNVRNNYWVSDFTLSQTF